MKASITALHLASLFYHVMRLLWRLCSKPNRQMPAPNIVVNPNITAAARRTSTASRLFASQDIVADIYAFLPRSDADIGQLTSRELRDAVDANSTKLPLRDVVVTLVSQT